MVVYHGAEKSTFYYGNEGLCKDPGKTWYRIPSLRRDRKGWHEVTRLHQDTNGDWTSNSKQKQWKLRGCPRTRAIFCTTLICKSVLSPFYTHSQHFISLCSQSTSGSAQYTHLTPRDGSQLRDYFRSMFTSKRYRHEYPVTNREWAWENQVQARVVGLSFPAYKTRKIPRA